MKLSNHNIRNIAVMALISTLSVLSGCATQQHAPDAGTTASADVQHAISSYVEQHNYHRAVAGLENALDTYQGRSFNQSTLTALAMLHLDYGNRLAFLQTADRLEASINKRDYIPEQTQHVLATAFAMRERPHTKLPGRGYDYSHVRSVYKLLGVRS